MRKRTYIILCFLLCSCVKEQPWNLKTVPSDEIAVECIITNEYKQHQIKISKPYYELNGKAEALSGATVTISYNDKILNCPEKALTPGTYESPAFNALPNVIYTLKIEFAGKSYTATASTIRATFFTPINYTIDEKTGLYHFNTEFDSDEPAMFEVTVDWRKTDNSYVTGDTAKQLKFYRYVLKTVDLNQLMTQQEKLYFPKGSEVTQKKYSLSAAHARFIRSFLRETKWRGGYFDEYPANAGTNFSVGAIGFFGACEVITIYQTVK